MELITMEQLFAHPYKQINPRFFHEVTRDLNTGPLQGEINATPASQQRYMRAGMQSLNRAQANSSRIATVARSMASSTSVFARLGAVLGRVAAAAPMVAAVALAVAAVAGVGYGLYKLFSPSKEAAKEAAVVGDKPSGETPNGEEARLEPEMGSVPDVGPGRGFLRYYDKVGPQFMVDAFFSHFLASLSR
jgi:hypothetical protein